MIHSPSSRMAVLLVYLLVALGGCRSRGPSTFKATPEDCYHAIATQVEYPNVEVCSLSEDWAALAPISLATVEQPEYWDVKLEQVVQMALSQSKVIRDLGGAVLRFTGHRANLLGHRRRRHRSPLRRRCRASAFDAQFSTSVFGEKNDRALNNEFFGGGTRLLRQDLLVQQTQITKQAVTGTQFSFRHYTDYDSNNAPSNLFPITRWNTNFETEVRHPFLQGSGMEFNRIAAPPTSRPVQRCAHRPR